MGSVVEMAKKSPLELGIDFDGVLAYNPFRVTRAPVTYFKRHFLGMKNTKFYIPKTRFEKLIWAILHESSVYPAGGTAMLRQLVGEEKVKAHLITARFRYLQPSLEKWLDRYNLTNLFASITINTADEQPHIYKERIIREKKLDIYIEDNWDIVSYVVPRNKKTKIYWIYNITDRHKEYQFKYPYLKRALEALPIYKQQL
jgi:hypothetical protein